MKSSKIFTLLAVLLCATTTWAQTEVSTDSELREAIQTGGGGTGPVLSRDIDLDMDFLLDFDQLE